MEDESTFNEKESEKTEKPKFNAKKAKDTAGAVGKSILDFIDKGVEAGKKGFKSAGSAINEFGVKSVLRIELSQFRGKRAKALAELGSRVYDLLSKEGVNSVDASDEQVASIIEEITTLNAKIQRHEDALAKTEKAKASPQKDSSTTESATDTANEVASSEGAEEN